MRVTLSILWWVILLRKFTFMTPSTLSTPLHLEDCVHHADIALCEANNGMSMALLVQSVYAVFLACFFSTNRCGADVMLFLYASISLRFTIVVCCNYSSASVAQDILWCSTVQGADGADDDDVRPWSWIARCQDDAGTASLCGNFGGHSTCTRGGMHGFSVPPSLSA